MKNLINIWRLFTTLRKNAHLFKVVEDIFKFVETTHEKQVPMVTKIVLLNMDKGEKIEDFVSLWAGIGMCNPIERACQLKAQNIELKRLLNLAKGGGISKSDYDLIELTLKMFD